MNNPTDTNQPDHIVDMHEMVTDTNQTSEDELRDLTMRVMRYANSLSPRKLDDPVDPIVNDAIGDTVADIKAIIRTEKLKLLDRLDKSMPTDEQLTTRYGYYMPDKKHGYRLAVHDIRETIWYERKKLDDHR